MATDAGDHAPPNNRLLVAVLAAGGSRRLGQPKQLAPLDGEPLLRRQCRIALEAGIGPVEAILGCQAAECAATIADLPVVQHFNPRWAEGLGGSIGQAAQAAIHAEANGLLLLQVDQYRLMVADLHSLYAAWADSGGLCACAAAYGDVIGPPVIFPRECFSELMRLEGDVGARRVLAKLPVGMLKHVEMPSASYDLDLPSQLPLTAG